MKSKLARNLAVAALAALPITATQATGASPTNYTGYFVLDLQVVMTTAVPSGDAVGCELNVFTDDSGSGGTLTTYTEYGFTHASATTGTVSCVVQVPYEWLLGSASTDVVTFSYSTAIYNPNATQNPTKVRFTTHTLPPITGVPVSGTITHVSATARL